MNQQQMDQAQAFVDMMYEQEKPNVPLKQTKTSPQANVNQRGTSCQNSPFWGMFSNGNIPVEHCAKPKVSLNEPSKQDFKQKCNNLVDKFADEQMKREIDNTIDEIINEMNNKPEQMQKYKVYGPFVINPSD